MNNKYRIILILIIAVAVIPFFVRVEKIDAGNVGIKVNLVGDNRGVSDITEVTGWVFYIPALTAIYEFPTYVQIKDYEEFSINSKDGTEFTVDPVFNYSINADVAPKMFRTFRKTLPELEDGYLSLVIQDAYRIIANRFSSDSLISNRENFEREVENILSKDLSENGFDFRAITSKLEPPQSLKMAIELKNKTKQEAIQAENKLKQEEANAKALIIAAETEKRANDLKTQSYHL